ncbi:chemotaxis protein histidine kinase CheA [Kitasatospora gansuensis]|uniref:Chemotaxis protein histidine kinase CheA n=2 Tax=Kitasatospora TaxID=2063 RepID=A0A7W7SIX7_9ACTN|nr:DNA/RNA non-specific endonuclease [Kitasatospora gansuensis]MBB4951290.1 chemotaxis protein histidine kinase CheA [Kitasatospora gansuensis]
MALLVPVVGAGVQTITATNAVAVTAPSGTAVPVRLALPGGFEAALATLLQEVEEENKRVAELAQQEKEVVAEAERITKAAAALDNDIQANNAKTTAANQKTSSLNTRTQALNAKIDAHNAKPNKFQLPAQAAAANAYQAEVNELRSEQSQLQAEASGLQSERAQVEQERAGLTSRKSELTSASRANDSKASTLRNEAQQLQNQNQQLLQQMAQAVQSLVETPPSPAATMDRGGDAPAPPQRSEPSQGQDTDTADSPYRQPQISALKAYEKESGTSVDMRPGTAYLTPEAVSKLPAAQAAVLGSPSITYDGLARKPNGRYTALRVRTPEAAALPALAPEVLGTAGLVVHQAGRKRVVDEVKELQEAPSSSQPAPGSTPTPEPTREPKDCRSGFGGGWRTYLPIDQSGRAQGAEACLDEAWLNTHEGSTTTRDIRPLGYEWAGRYGAWLGSRPPNLWINNCHLLAASLSGSGTDLANLATCSRAANASKQAVDDPGMNPNMASIEAQVKKAIVADHQIVHYTVVARYEGTRTVPYEFDITAVGTHVDGSPGIDVHSAIQNRIFGVNSGGWFNLGRADENSAPVPTGAMK